MLRILRDLGPAEEVEAMPPTLRERQEVVHEQQRRYRKSKGHKSEILAKVMQLLGYNLCYATRALRGAHG